MLSFPIALVSNCSKNSSVLLKAISATGGQLLFDSGSAGAIATECSVLCPDLAGIAKNVVLLSDVCKQSLVALSPRIKK